MDLSAYKLSIIGVVAVLVLSAGLFGILGGWANAAPYLTLVGTFAVPALLALLRSETTAKTVTEQHAQNQSVLANIDDKINLLADGNAKST